MPQQLVPAGIVERIVHGRQIARLQLVNTGDKLVAVSGEVLCDFGLQVKTDDKGLIVLRPNRLAQKLDGRFLLELKAIPHRLAGIDQESDLHGKISLAVETEYLLRRLAIIQNLEIVLLQAFDVSAVLIGDGEKQVYFAHRRAQYEQRFIRFSCCTRILGLRVLIRSRRG